MNKKKIFDDIRKWAGKFKEILKERYNDADYVEFYFLDDEYVCNRWTDEWSYSFVDNSAIVSIPINTIDAEYYDAD